MKVRRPSLWRLSVLLLVIVPFAAWMLVKPVRVLAPSLVGLSCDRGPVCTEDPEQWPVANSLYAEGMAFVSVAVAPVEGAPRAVFCATQACADRFGLGARAAVTVGTWGTVYAPRAWKPYFVRHELIHVLQGQRLGLARRLLLPTWFVEGMAYALSEDPRAPLAEPWEAHRNRFNEWFRGMTVDRLWLEARQL
ncbi:hypothetical protein [Hydrogenophaga sp. RWCD_12]|uniref:hypothetical protein n=1 Tax=Hydrogenophaga sp. RWCD_12 TaxID=3391190 RepID=UPI00398492FC